MTFLACVSDSVVRRQFILLFEKSTRVHQLKNPCFTCQYESVFRMVTTLVKRTALI